MDIVFQPSGNFDEVYLYEELMEADLHAIVCPIIRLRHIKYNLSGFSDPIRTTAHGRPLPVLLVPNALRSEIHTFCQRPPS